MCVRRTDLHYLPCLIFITIRREWVEGGGVQGEWSGLEQGELGKVEIGMEDRMWGGLWLSLCTKGKIKENIIKDGEKPN